jgi:thymidylate synthase (FAD)
MAYDVMDNLAEKTVNCLDHGHVTLVDCMPRLVPDTQKTADCAIVQAARVSYGDGTKTLNEDRGLIRYLMRHKHTTPFEMCEFKFHCKMPIFIARQWIRHRTANVNEYSGRYSILKDEFFIPEAARQQSTSNKQGGDEILNNSASTEFSRYLSSFCSEAYSKYQELLDKGVSRELARISLPVNLYTEWYWKIDLHNLLHFLALRCDSHAQYEIRVFADAMLELIKPIVPISIEAWEDYSDHRGSIKLTKLEVEAIKSTFNDLKAINPEAFSSLTSIQSENKREQQEWESKASRLGLGRS